MVSKYGKLLDKSLNPDIAKAYRDVEFDSHLINEIIAQHFYRQGLFDLGDCFVNETQEPNAAALKTPFYEMYQNLEHLRAKDLEPALMWARKHREALDAKVILRDWGMRVRDVYPATVEVILVCADNVRFFAEDSFSS